jgi:hypothetical protein
MKEHIMSNERITELLIADHRRLDILLERAAAGPRLDAVAFETFRAGLLRHIAIEEKLLLPAARRARGGEPITRAHALRIDHGALGTLLVPSPDHALCAELARIITTHDALEEGPGGVYEECEALIGPDQSRVLCCNARAFPEIKVARHFDGEGVVRTAELALASARRIVAPRTQSPEA